MSTKGDDLGHVQRSWLTRAAAYLAFWTILCGDGLADLVLGTLVAVTATWTSLHLLPVEPGRFNLIKTIWLVLRFLRQSVVAGIDVAWRAFDPRLSLRPGFVTYPTGFASGNRRNVFTALTSLLPGTVPIGGDRDCLVYHCLDTNQPVASELAAEEAALSQVFGDD